MHQDIIQSFLTLSEVVGVALMQGRVIPYFVIKDQVVNPERKLELVRQIRKHALENLAFSDNVTLQINEYNANIYKISDFISILIISERESLAIRAIAKKALTSLSNELSLDQKSFESLIKKIDYPVQNTCLIIEDFSKDNTEKQENSAISSSLEDVLHALNALSEVVCIYLGEKITANFWQLTRPNRDWLNKFKIKSSAKIEFTDSSQIFLSPLQHLFIREWTNLFINQCSQIIRDLPMRIDSEIKNPSYRKLISIVPNGYLGELYSLSQDNESLFENK